MPSITLLSDFGWQDASVAIAKGVLLQHLPGANITDISHDISPFELRQAAYLFASAYKNFPAGTCHILLFDLFSDLVPRLVLAEYEGRYFLTPDNGLLPLALGAIPANAWLCLELKDQLTFTDWLHASGKTAANLPGIPDLPPFRLRETLQNKYSTFRENEAVCEIIHIDHYENVVVNFTRKQYDEALNGRSFLLQFMQTEEIAAISTNYQDVRPGHKLCRFNSNGYLEICINRGKAASLFGLRLGSKHNNIKIVFG